MRKLKLSLIFSLLATLVMAQDFSLSGKVTDAENAEPLIGASVVEKGTSNGTITDIEGNYQLTVSSADAILVVSYVGYGSMEVSINGRTLLDISMDLDLSELEEVVVIGYGTQKEKDLTSAITTVKAEEIAKTPTGQAMQALQGKVAGVQIVSNGVPGNSPTVRVRGIGSYPGQGNADPLYVVDGMFFDNIDFLNPSDIASISVLKDASAAAIYGVRAANGVVLIETKAGSYNSAPQVTYDGYYGVQVPQNVLKMANAEQFTQYALETGSAADASYIDNAMQRYGRSRINPNVPAVNTDWYDEIMKASAPIQNHSLNVSGGNDKTVYSLGASYFQQEGLLKEAKNEYDRLNMRAKVDVDATDWLKIGGNLNVSNATRYSAENAAWFRAYYAVPIMPVHDEQNTDATNGYANAQDLGYRSSQNPYTTLAFNDNRLKIRKVLANFHAEVELIPNKLKFRTAYNYNTQSLEERLVDLPYNTGRTVIDAAIQKKAEDVLNQIWDNTLTYNESFGQHSVVAMAGYSYRDESTQAINVRGTDFDNFGGEETWYIDQANTIVQASSGDFGFREYGVSYFGRLAYNFDDRYLLYGTFRAEGTSRYQETWGYFPTIGAGWVISEEQFMQNVAPVSFLKIRGSWGKLGNDSVNPSVGGATTSVVTTAIDGQRVTGLVVDNTYDSLGWEVVAETNIGLTARFLNNRLSLDADYYIRDTENAVISLQIPVQGGSVRRNNGVIRNEGLEVALNWSDNLGKDVNYNIGLNFATLNNETLDLGGQPYIDGGSAEFRQRTYVGQPLLAFYGREVLGVYQNEEDILNSGLSEAFLADANLEPGDFIYKDQDGDGDIDDQDRVILGSYLPSFTYGFNVGLIYKNWEFTANFQGQRGNKILNRKRGEIIFTNDANIDADLATNLWRGEGTSNKYPSAAGLRKGWNQALSDYFIEDGSYFRVQNVRVSYRIPASEVLGRKTPETKVTFTAERPITMFDYNGFNPEVSNGIDRQVYPIPAVYTMGVNMKF